MDEHDAPETSLIRKTLKNAGLVGPPAEEVIADLKRVIAQMTSKSKDDSAGTTLDVIVDGVPDDVIEGAVPELKKWRRDQRIQVKFDRRSKEDIETVAEYFRVSAAAVVRQAWRTYFTLRGQASLGRDVGALDTSTGIFHAFDVPFGCPSLGLHRGIGGGDNKRWYDESRVEKQLDLREEDDGA